MRIDVAKEIEKYKGDFNLINKSELARRLNCDRRTIERYVL
jgi:ActR/RegA family two-component response regulator